MTTKMLSSLLLASSLLATTACGKKADKQSTAAPLATEGTAAVPAAAAAAAPAAALADIDLSKAGPAWQGVHMTGLAGAEVTDNGTGGAIINFSDNTMLQLSTVDGEPDLKQFKTMMAANYKTVSYSVDTPTEVVFTAVSDMGGTPIEGYGFSTTVTVGSAKYTCGSSYDDAATAKRMLDVCKSVAKR